MRRRPFRWQCLIVVLGLATCGAGGGIDTARAQAFVPSGTENGGLVYHKQLDLGLNPMRTDEAVPPPADQQEDVLQERSLDALVPEYDGGGRAHTRVVHGTRSRRGEWPTVVSLDVLKERGRSGSLCAGTVIDSHWILTAAHCVFSKRQGGVKGLRSVTAFAKSNLARVGEARRVKSVIVHPKFAAVPRAGKGAGLINDIALLELETATTAPRQKLAAQAGQSSFLAPGTMMTVVGWGLTGPRRPDQRQDSTLRSKVLLRANVPVAERKACDAFLGFLRAPTGSVFCAGDGKGGADSCNGDSGGPILVAGHAGEPIQAGVVSWGDGCALPGTYGAYTEIAGFEQWIRKHVPKAQWATPRAAKPALAAIAGIEPAGPPAPHGQVTADLYVHGCKRTAAVGLRAAAAGTAASRVKIGSCITVRVTSGATGHLAVFNRDAEGRTRQIFPNRYSSGRLAGRTPTSVRAGQVVEIPGDLDGFNFKVGGPPGRNEIIAIVVPEGVDLADITKDFESMRSIDDFEDVLAGIAGPTRRIEVTPRTPRAVGTRQFDVVQ